MSGSEQGPESAAPTSGAEPRAGDAERELVAEKLRVAAGEGRIDLAELDERLDQAYRAKTYRELDALLADLPDHRPAGVRAAPVAGTMLLKTHGSTVKQNGRWTVPRKIVAEAGVSNIVIDFTASRYYAPVAPGIWCGSWEAGCRALGIPGHFQVLTPEERAVPVPVDTPRYHVSWIADDTVTLGS